MTIKDWTDFSTLEWRYTGFSAKLKLTKPLERYPVYEPPHRECEAALPNYEAAQENFRHFYNSRNERLDQLAEFMSNFGVRLTLDANGLRMLSHWISIYGFYLVEMPETSAQKTRDAGLAYLRYRPAWSGQYKGLNVIFDITTYKGEYILQRFPGAEWFWIGKTAVSSPPTRTPRGSMPALIRGLPFDGTCDVYMQSLMSFRSRLKPAGYMKGVEYECKRIATRSALDREDG